MKNGFRFTGYAAAVAMLMAGSFLLRPAVAQEAWPDTEKPVLVAYLTGYGCHNCAETDSHIFNEWVRKYPRMIVFDYEIFGHQKENFVVKTQYFQNYLSPDERPGVPFIMLSPKLSAIGRYNVANFEKVIELTEVNLFPMPDGTARDFKDLDLEKMDGVINIWTKNRVLISGTDAKGQNLKQVLLKGDMRRALEGIAYEETLPIPVRLSVGEMTFENAVMIGDWRLQWNGEPVEVSGVKKNSSGMILFWVLMSVIFVFIPVVFFRKRKVAIGEIGKFSWKTRARDLLIAVCSLGALAVFFVLAQKVSPDILKSAGYKLPLPLFTFLIAIVDGFNPCNMFVLTGLLALLIATSSSRTRLYIVGFSFVVMVYVFYYLFMAAWLNAFNYIGFVTPLRVAIGVVAIIGGIINCKELFFFGKGPSLTIQEQHKGPLKKRMEKVKEVIQKGSLPLLISSSLGLAALASLVELPCTAGFPIIYVGVLTGKGMSNTVSYYGYLALYNLVYVIPLFVIIAFFIWTFRARQLTQWHLEIMKFIGGLIMLLLGIVLLVNPALIGLSMGQ